jgi:hypothetical protein
MLHRVSSKSANLVSLGVSAIAGSILAASLVSSPVSSIEAQLVPAQPVQAIAVRPGTTETTTVNRVLVMAIAFGGAVGVCLALNMMLDGKRSTRSFWNTSSNTPRSSQPYGSFNQVSRPLQRKLLLLLHQDLAAANRLLMQASFKYPGKSTEWYAEKVIYDLQRDRGRI